MDYDENLPVYYKNNYEFFSRYLPHVKHKKDNGLLEKAQIHWFSYAALKKQKKNFRSFYQNIVDLIIKEEKFITNKMITSCKTKKCREILKKKLRSTFKKKK